MQASSEDLESLQLEEVRARLCACCDASAVLLAILRLPEDKNILVVCLLWRWWTWRNKINAGENAGSLDRLPAEINHWAIDSLTLCRSPCTEQRVQSIHVWRKPEEGWLKLNCDGAFSEVPSTGGWGFVVRDHLGDVRGSGAGSLHNVASAVQAEVAACAAALEAAACWGMTNVQVELDFQVLVKALQGTEADLAAEGLLLKEIHEYARMNFNRVSFSFAPRACNKLAHELAAFGARRPVDREFWSEDLPDDVLVRQASVMAGPV